MTALHLEQTVGLILGAALGLLERRTVGELTFRDVAQAAGVSERTVFRHFQTRDAFLDALARQVSEALDAPPPPRSMEELLAFPATLFRAFEAKARLTQAALHSELFPRLREGPARERWRAIRALVDASAPEAPRTTRETTAANIRYFLSATTWNYYRSYFGLGLDASVACVEAAIRQALAGLDASGGITARSRSSRSGSPRAGTTAAPPTSSSRAGRRSAPGA